MVNSSLFQQVVKNLEQHENAWRIKKLIYCLCKNTWENDKNKLNHISWQYLVQELRKTHPSLETLKISLFKAVKTLNKPGEYAEVAKVIYGNVGRLYPESQKVTRDNGSASTVQSANQELPKAKEKSRAAAGAASQPQRKAYDLFAVRSAVMSSTNPLRAKILVFSTIYQPFDFSKQAWLNLRLHELDDLLEKLFKACQSITELESQLNRTARSLKNTNENNKAAMAIVQCLKPFYAPRQQSMNQTQAARSTDEETITMARSKAAVDQMNQLVGDSADENENTCQVFPS